MGAYREGSDKLAMTYRIRSLANGIEYWSNDSGWVEKASATIFTQEERDSLPLPIGGKWTRATRNFKNEAKPKAKRVKVKIGPDPANGEFVALCSRCGDSNKGYVYYKMYKGFYFLCNDCAEVVTSGKVDDIYHQTGELS